MNDKMLKLFEQFFVHIDYIAENCDHLETRIKLFKAIEILDDSIMKIEKEDEK